MDAKGRSTANISIEWFWKALKYEDVYPISYNTIKEARCRINEYINIYNSQRLHLSLNYHIPDEIYYPDINKKRYNVKKILLEVA